MRLIGGAFSWVFALIPIVYIGAMLWYFAGVGGNSAKGIVGIGLGPTVIGLAIVGLLLALPLVIKLLRVVSGTNRVPGAGAAAGEPLADTQGFDPDAAFANYMRGRDSALPPPIAPDAIGDDLRPFTPRPGGFGRKGV
ncbi:MULTISPECIES: hypothetical protein [unclassified Sphingopyxis]|uniref:hypothetical protein n=1 Tax=unclassified Sphingopyxis TaxID=2614943 RepID=UPI0024ADE2A2|nr:MULTISPECIES: hypothetical protein [unclassified Sphingopyxis]